MSKVIVVVSVGCFSLALGGCAPAVGARGQGQQDAVWVCHGNRNPRWLRVAAPAADAHRRHGDRVSSRPREEGSACENQTG